MCSSNQRSAKKGERFVICAHDPAETNFHKFDPNPGERRDTLCFVHKGGDTLRKKRGWAKI